MEVSEKKLGCLAGIKRTNMQKDGYIEGSINETLKSGQKEVSVIGDKVVFWIVNDYDVTVGPEDIASCAVAGINVFTRKRSVNEKDKRVDIFEHTVNYNLEFKNGKSGVLKVRTLDVYGKAADYEHVNKIAFARKICPDGYVAEVAGWLTPDGGRDEKYNYVFCPEGYKADIIGFRKISCSISRNVLAKKLGLTDAPMAEKVEFGGKKIPFIMV